MVLYASPGMKECSKLTVNISHPGRRQQEDKNCHCQRKVNRFVSFSLRLDTTIHVTDQTGKNQKASRDN